MLVSTHVAPAAAHSPTSTPGGTSTTRSKGPACRRARSEPRRRARRAPPVREDRSETGRPIAASPDGPPVGPVGRYPDRDPAALDREWLEPAAPQLVEAFEAVIEQAGPFAIVDGLAEGLEVLRVPEPDPHREATATQVIQRHGLPGDLVHSPAGQWGDHRPESDGLGRTGDRAERYPRVRDRATLRRICEPVPEEQAVPTP